MQTNPNLFANQIFVDGTMVNEARWPNSGLDQMRPVRSIAEAGTTVNTIYDSHLTQPVGFWVGATVHFWGHEAYLSQTAAVTASAPGQITFSGVTGCPWMCTTEFSKYYLSGIKAALDSPGEWYYDKSAQRISLWTPNGKSPATHSVEVKQRNYAFDLSGRSYITIAHMHLFANTITTDDASSNDVIDGITARYLTHFNFLPNPDNSFFGFADAYRGKEGISLNGSNNVLRNSDLGLSAGAGIFLHGRGHTVTDNNIHDLDYMGAAAGGIQVNGDNMHIDHNTLYRAGYNIISVGVDSQGQSFKNEAISYNDIFNSNMLNRDGGGIYLCCDTNNGKPVDASGTIIDHNLIHDSQLVNINTTADYNGAGIYPDNGTSGLVIHHNVLWNNVSDAFHRQAAVTQELKDNPSWASEGWAK